MTVVIGTAGHIDHGKTTLLRALTGIDADRLPEERRRGMTIDVGYAHLRLDDGSEIDFVDVPGHDRLVGNMLVGAGEIDAALLVVAADDGPRAQTIEHLELLDALGIRNGVAVVAKADLVPPERLEDVVNATRALLARTTLAGALVLPVSATRAEGLDELRAALVGLRDAVHATSRTEARPSRIAIDRAFVVRGRGTVVTGTLRGEPVTRGSALRLVPGEAGRGTVRIREIQVHGGAVDRAGPGRTALAIAGPDLDRLTRGHVLAGGPDVVETTRMLVVLRPPAHVRAGLPAPSLPRDGASLTLHLGTDHATTRVVRSGRETVLLDAGAAIAVLRLDRPMAAALGDRFVLRDAAAGAALAGGLVIDPLPARGVSRRRATADRLAALAAVAEPPGAAVGPLVDLHGALPVTRVAESGGNGGPTVDLLVAGPVALARDVAARLATIAAVAVEAAAAGHDAVKPGAPVPIVRAAVAAALRRAATVDRDGAEVAAAAFVEALVRAGRLARSGERLLAPGASAMPAPRAREALDRLVADLDTPTPPALAAAVRAAGCSPEAVRALESAGEIVRVDDDLAFAAPVFARLESVAIAMAEHAPLTPAAYRDAIGSSRKYVMALLEEFGRRGVLTRTAEGHVPGPRRPVGAPSER